MLYYNHYKIGTNPNKLIIFLHGYNGDIADHQYAIDWLREKLTSAILVIPQAPEISEKNPNKRQWFGMLQYDKNNKRIDPNTTVNEIMQIYNTAAPDIDRNSKIVEDFITEMQEKFNISAANSYLIGFSQGAMLALYTTLTCKNKLGGAFILSALVAGAEMLSSKINSRPPLYLFHGIDDHKVQYKTLSFTLDWLTQHKINYQCQTYDNLTHKICEKEIEFITEIINRNSVY